MGNGMPLTIIDIHISTGCDVLREVVIALAEPGIKGNTTLRKCMQEGKHGIEDLGIGDISSIATLLGGSLALIDRRVRDIGKRGISRVGKESGQVPEKDGRPTCEEMQRRLAVALVDFAIIF